MVLTLQRRFAPDWSFEPLLEKSICLDQGRNFWILLKIICYHHNARRIHDNRCSPCNHHVMPLEDLWSTWDETLLPFCKFLLEDSNRMFEVQPSRPDLDSHPDVFRALKKAYVDIRTPLPTWFVGETPCIVAFLDEQDPPTTLTLPQINKKLFEYGLSRPSLAPITWTQLGTNNLLKSVAYAQGLLGWANNGLGCELTVVLQDEYGPSSNPEAPDDGEWVRVMAARFFKAVFRELGINERDPQYVLLP